MTNWDTEAARRYHELTKHSFESVRRSAHRLDWGNRPNPFKEYPGVEPMPLPDDLARLLRFGAGVIRERTLPGGEAYHFRTYSSAGALYPVEVYPVTAEGVHHFHPRELALRRLREGDFRGLLAPDAEVVLVLTGILWRTAWKYGARGYRHLWWDAGTMLANLLALEPSARVVTGFVDAEVNRLLGLDGEREASLALLSLGRAEPAPSPEIEPLELESLPLSAREVPYPEAHALHAASRLGSVEEVRRYRVGEGVEGPGLERAEDVIRRRGSIREFARDPVPAEQLAAILAAAAAPIPADFPACTELYLIANAVGGLAQGTYRFTPPDGFELLREGNFRIEAGYLVLEQPLGALAAATIFLMTDLERVLEALGNRGYRAAQLEAGIRVGRVYLGAYAEGVAATASTFYDDDVTRFLAPGKSPLLCVAVGQDPRAVRAA